MAPPCAGNESTKENVSIGTFCWNAADSNVYSEVIVSRLTKELINSHDRSSVQNLLLRNTCVLDHRGNTLLYKEAGLMNYI
jgi:hypothetical protein